MIKKAVDLPLRGGGSTDRHVATVVVMVVVGLLSTLILALETRRIPPSAALRSF